MDSVSCNCVKIQTALVVIEQSKEIKNTEGLFYMLLFKKLKNKNKKSVYENSIPM